MKKIHATIKQEVGDQKAIIAVSGGIDSSVCALLAKKAIGAQLHPVFLRTGFNLPIEEERLNEFSQQHGLDVTILDKEALFEQLYTIEDPYERRYRFGQLSLTVLKEFAEHVGATVLINGVNRNDKIISNTVISFAERSADARRVLGLQLVEPLADLLKEQVRELATTLGLSALLKRQHIPGPALAVRIAGEITKEKLELMRAVSTLLDEEKPDDYWMFFPFLLKERLDEKYLLVLRAVTSDDEGFTAEPKHDPELLNRLAKRILGAYPSVGRVLFDLSPKGPATIEFM